MSEEREAEKKTLMDMVDGYLKNIRAREKKKGIIVI